MTTDPQERAAQRAAATYDSASDTYLSPALSFWDRYGSRTVERLHLTPGLRVADLCCGAGASAIASAKLVGEAGSVVGMDVSRELLESAGRRARAAGLANLEFRQVDATAVDEPDASFDVVVCVFGVFFAADPVSFVREMVRLVKPTGTIAVTTWGEGWGDPLSSAFWDEVKRVRPELHRSFNPWDEYTSASALTELLRTGGVKNPAAEYVSDVHPVEVGSDYWDFIQGTGYRATTDALSEADLGSVRGHMTERLRQAQVRALRMDVVYGVSGT